MDYKLLITNEAKCDIDEIISYIVNELKNPIAAENLLTKIELSFDTISSNPLAFPLCSDKRLRDGGYRKITVKNYIVFYRVDDINHIVYIMRVIYGRRNYIEII